MNSFNKINLFSCSSVSSLLYPLGKACIGSEIFFFFPISGVMRNLPGWVKANLQHVNFYGKTFGKGAVEFK